MSQPSPGHPALARRLLRAAGSLTALALLLVGVPWILAAAGTLPGGAPSGSDLSDALLSPDDGHVLLTVLTLVAWALWAWFALGVLAELPGLVRRRRPARRRRVLGAPQRLAGFLLGGLLVLPAGTAMAAPAPALAATAPVQPTVHTDETGDAEDAGRAASRAPDPAGPVHVVGETGETVWDLAVEYLGSGSRAHEIRTLNPHLPHTALLPSGLSVRLPADARLMQAEPASDTPEMPAPQVQLAASEQPITTADDSEPRQERTHTVRAGESLSRIAKDETGDAGRWPQLYEASRNKDQPGDTPRVSDPNLIYSGQQITIPAADAPGDPHQEDRPDAPGDPSGEEKDGPQEDTGQDQDGKKDGERGGSGSAGGADRPTESAKPTPSPAPERTGQHPSTPASGRDGDTPSAAPSAPSSPAPSTQRPAEAGAEESPSLLTTRLAGVLVSLAAAVTLALSIRRILQRRRAKPGELIAMPEEVSPAEAQMAQAADPAGPLRLDRALRTLADHAAREGQPLPALRGARLTSTGVQVLPEDLHAAPATPFTAGAGGWWVCEDTVELLDEPEAAHIVAPYPGMVTVGADESGHLVLLNLPHAGAILLDGEQEQVEEVLISMALELGMSPWATDVEVVVVGFGEGLNHLLPTSRIAYMRESAHAARDFAERLLEAHQEREESRTPHLILCASELTADSAWQIAETLDKASGVLQVALLAPASSANLLFEQTEVIDAASDQRQRIDILGADVTLQRLQRQAVDDITAALAVSGQDPHPADGAWKYVPSESQTTHAAQKAAADHQLDEAGAAAHIPAPGPVHRVPAAEPAPGSDDGQSTTKDGEDLGVFPALLAASPSPAAISLPVPTAPEAVHPAAPGGGEHAADPGSLSPLEAAGEGATTPGPDPHGPAPRVPAAHADPGVPFIRVLGPVTISGVTASRHGTREAQLAALLHLKPGRSADTLCADMDPGSPWSTDTLNARLGGLRRSLGHDEDGNPYVPRRAVKSDPYTLSDKICCDWHRLQHAVEAALPHGPAGLAQLEKALDQVRGRPFGAHPLPWSEPLQQEMVMRIVSVAHIVATYRLSPSPHQDLTLARRATATGLEVDQTAELLYRDWFQIEAAAGNRSGLNTAIARLDQVNRSLQLPMEIETEQLIHHLLQQVSPTPQR
ncbi:LysM peptidoglycan-binding domain-containing protein [Streptomyces sp. BA2]|uniref:LysM peptidoglycan-binding domain-containing protein n=1 Tax=Streptomyces sp. BA2 TaxID=436595 RepID=UPI001321D92D|nr:LysM peptidoglycan-binding domain-containing protein [Streptomyces sp. BA2]MWA07707.1 LysM peptidoglycan-binding domain-containing protein [Streptomyces sp. BA2]